VIPETIGGKQTAAGIVQRTIRSGMDEDHRYLLHGDRKDATYYPYAPFQPADFVAIMFDVAAEVNGPKFLDMRCGPGTKMELADRLYGLKPFGAEHDPDLALNAARKYGGRVFNGDYLAILPSFIRQMDVVWLYSPYRDDDKALQLEYHVRKHMKPGAILAGASLSMGFDTRYWQTVVDDWGSIEVRGAWKKLGEPGIKDVTRTL